MWVSGVSISVAQYDMVQRQKRKRGVKHIVTIVCDFISKLPEWAKASFNIHIEVK